MLALIHKDIKGLEKATRGDWMGANQNSSMEHDLYPNWTRHPSLLTQLRPHSYSKAVDPRNRVRKRRGNTNRCRQDHVLYRRSKSGQRTVYIFTSISPNTWRAHLGNHRGSAIRTRKPQAFDPAAQELCRLHPTTIHTQSETEKPRQKSSMKKIEHPKTDKLSVLGARTPNQLQTDSWRPLWAESEWQETLTNENVLWVKAKCAARSS
jgi:hypothetical protein